MVKSSVGVSLLTVAFGICVQTVAAAATDPRIEAFRDACIADRQDYAALKQRALAEGWTPARPGMDAELDALLAESATVELDPGMSAMLETYLKTVAGGEAFLVLTYFESEQANLVSCYVYDFTATEPIAPDAISDWLGAPPSDVVDQPSVIIGYTWGTPERLPGTWDVYLAFLPEGGAASVMTGFSGLLIKITSIDPKEV